MTGLFRFVSSKRDQMRKTIKRVAAHGKFSLQFRKFRAAILDNDNFTIKDRSLNWKVEAFGYDP
jgi:hypothetical protein